MAPLKKILKFQDWAPPIMIPRNMIPGIITLLKTFIRNQKKRFQTLGTMTLVILMISRITVPLIMTGHMEQGTA